jgi:hypothetical protein
VPAIDPAEALSDQLARSELRWLITSGNAVQDVRCQQGELDQPGHIRVRHLCLVGKRLDAVPSS